LDFKHGDNKDIIKQFFIRDDYGRDCDIYEKMQTSLSNQ